MTTSIEVMMKEAYKVRENSIPLGDYQKYNEEHVGDIEALVKANLPYAINQAKSYAARFNGVVDLEDIISGALLGLVYSARSFDSSKGSFSTVAVWWIRREVLSIVYERMGMSGTMYRRALAYKSFSEDYFKKHARQPSIKEIADHLGLSEKQAKNAIAESSKLLGRSSSINDTISTNSDVTLSDSQAISSLYGETYSSEEHALDGLDKNDPQKTLSGCMTSLPEPFRSAVYQCNISTQKKPSKSFMNKYGYKNEEEVRRDAKTAEEIIRYTIANAHFLEDLHPPKNIEIQENVWDDYTRRCQHDIQILNEYEGEITVSAAYNVINRHRKNFLCTETSCIPKEKFALLHEQYNIDVEQYDCLQDLVDDSRKAVEKARKETERLQNYIEQAKDLLEHIIVKDDNPYTNKKPNFAVKPNIGTKNKKRLPQRPIIKISHPAKN